MFSRIITKASSQPDRLCQAIKVLVAIATDRSWGSFHTLYGDADDPELKGLLPLENAQWVVSTLPNYSMGLSLLHTLKSHDFRGQVALTSHNQQDADILLDAGADMVLLPFRDAAKQAACMLVNFSEPASIHPASVL